MVPLWVALCGVSRRDRRRWELREQLRQMVQTIPKEAMIDEDHWEPPMLWEMGTNAGFAQEDVMVDLGRLEINALGWVKHGDVPPPKKPHDPQKHLTSGD